MLDAIDRALLKEIADLETLPKGAFNIRKNGQLEARQSTANITIVSSEDGKGIDIHVKPHTKNESVHIPVVLSQGGLFDVVRNRFFIGKGADVLIVAGCGIHCGSDRKEGHAGVHEFHLQADSRIRYVEKHVASGPGAGKRILNPVTRIHLGPRAHAELELVQIGGVDEARRRNIAKLADGASLLIAEKVVTDGYQFAVSDNDIILEGDDARAELISRSVIRGDSRQEFQGSIEAHAPSYGHLECDAIVMDNGTNETVPALRAFHPDAELTHEAAIGKIANDQLTKLMSLGLEYDEAVARIISGFLR